MAGSFTLFSKVNSQSNIQQSLVNAARPRIVAAAEAGADIGPRLIAAYAASSTKPNSRVRSTPSLTDPSAYEGIVIRTKEGAAVRLKIRDGLGDDFEAKFYSVNNGVGGHPIFPSRAPKLVFPGTKRFEGQIIKVNSVSHPGNSARRFFQKGAKDMYQTILATLQ